MQYEDETVAVVYSAECKAVQKANRSTGSLPILVVLFVFSYGILTALVVEQGRTIESQRALIHEMLKDSRQLADLKGKIAHDENLRMHEKSSGRAGASETPNQQKDAVGATKPPGKNGKGSGKSSLSPKVAPGRPASDLEDVRRLTRSL